MQLKPLFKNIADAIREKDGATDTIVASTFPARIRAIPSGGGSYPSTPPDPVEVYHATRPADWLPMPEPQDDEMYLLFHIPDGVSSLLAFTVTCTGSYTVALGTVANGQFVQQSAVSVASGIKYEAELFADNFGDLTSDGFKQVMVKVSRTDILTWKPSAHAKKNNPQNFFAWNIVEISCKLPNGTAVRCGESSAVSALRQLKYFSWHGNNGVTNTSNMFYYCSRLTAIPQMDTTKVTKTSRMFSDCISLRAIPQVDTAKVTDMSYMFYSCYSLTSIPQMDTAKATNMMAMFSGCTSLRTIPQLDTAHVTHMNSMFYACSTLNAIPQLDTAKVINMNTMFSNCYALSTLKLTPSVVGWAGHNIQLEKCSLGHTALVKLFESLPAITTEHAITLTGNPGVAELTDAEKATATDKNWTLTL